MNLNDCEHMARQQMNYLGLEHWRFGWTRSKQVFGHCDYSEATIRLSKIFVGLNEWDEIKKTVLHEIAHALAFINHGDTGHGRYWEIQMRAFGLIPAMYWNHSSRSVNAPDHAVTYKCPSCGTEIKRHRRFRQSQASRTACRSCCQSKNGGKFDPQYIFQEVN